MDITQFLDSLTNPPEHILAPGPLEVAFAMAYSLVLNFLIATIYKKTYRGTSYSQDYVQTLIIIGTVTTILIMVVSGNGAIAFGMFAAFSVIRFRRTLGQSRDLAFVFFAMAIGMVVGAQILLDGRRHHRRRRPRDLDPNRHGRLRPAPRVPPPQHPHDQRHGL